MPGQNDRSWRRRYLAAALAVSAGSIGLATAAPASADATTPVSGTVYVAETADSRVTAVAPDGTQSTLATVHGVYGLAVDNAGNVLASDDDNSALVKIAPDGTSAARGPRLPPRTRRTKPPKPARQPPRGSR